MQDQHYDHDNGANQRQQWTEIVAKESHKLKQGYIETLATYTIIKVTNFSKYKKAIALHMTIGLMFHI